MQLVFLDAYSSALAIKFRAKTKEEIPTELQSLYMEQDGAFVLDVERAVDKVPADEGITKK